MDVVVAAACLLGAYLAGSLPFAVWVARAKGVDLGAFGSGNPGASNVARALSWRWGGLVVLLDAAKAAVPAAVGAAVGGPWLGVGSALAAVAGSLRSVFIGFRGGKGGATAGGAAFGIMPLVGVGLLVVWQLAYFASGRIASVGTVTAALAYPLLALATRAPAPYVAYAAASTLLVVWRHRANLARLRRGEERAIRRP